MYSGTNHAGGYPSWKDDVPVGMADADEDARRVGGSQDNVRGSVLEAGVGGRQ